MSVLARVRSLKLLHGAVATGYHYRTISHSSLRAAALENDKSKVQELDLSESEDLQCKNLMCEKFDFENTQACVCKLAKYLQINKFENLKVLKLGNNRIDTIPAPVFELASLEELDLSHNCLKSVPEDVANLSRLQVLDLSYNQLTEIPDTLKRVQCVKVTGNPIR